LTTDLLEGINNMITVLNDRNFANSLFGVQQQLTTFNTYRIKYVPIVLPARSNIWLIYFLSEIISTIVLYL